MFASKRSITTLVLAFVGILGGIYLLTFHSNGQSPGQGVSARRGEAEATAGDRATGQQAAPAPPPPRGRRVRVGGGGSALAGGCGDRAAVLPVATTGVVVELRNVAAAAAGRRPCVQP